MANIINELEVVLEPPAIQPKGGGKAPSPKPQVNPHDLLTIRDREERNRLRTVAH
jgi:hypothetical protein